MALTEQEKQPLPQVSNGPGPLKLTFQYEENTKAVDDTVYHPNSELEAKHIFDDRDPQWGNKIVKAMLEENGVSLEAANGAD